MGTVGMSHSACSSSVYFFPVVHTAWETGGKKQESQRENLELLRAGPLIACLFTDIPFCVHYLYACTSAPLPSFLSLPFPATYD